MLSIVEKFKEVFFSILPFSIVVLILHFTVVSLDSQVLAKFLIGTFMMMVSMPIFLQGIDISIAPIGERMSDFLVKTNKLWIVLLGGAIFGFIVTIAEPDLNILSGQVTAVTGGRFNSTLMVVMVSLGVGSLISLAMLRILKNIRLNRLLTVIYLVIFIFAVFSPPDFLAIAFDASGSTTGSVSVPFILALSVGISTMTRSNERETHDGFGMLGIGSAGAILAVLIQGVFSGAGPLEGSLPAPEAIQNGALRSVLAYIPQYAKETLSALLPILFIFLLANAFWIKTPPQKLARILVGSVYTYAGLVIFLTGVNAGFIEASGQVGLRLASLDKPWLLVAVGMLFGIITIPAEPSVHILTHQIEEETGGSIKALTVMLALCAGVGVAVGLSILRILIPSLQLWHILLPGTAIAIALSYYAPNIFVGIAFDSSGVAAGTMAAALILPFAQGVAEYYPGASVVRDAFGVIALVAMTPLIALQLLGLIYKVKSRPSSLDIDDFDDGTEEVLNVE